MHPQSIGIHECEEDNIAGVICLNISSTEVTNTSVMKKNGTDTKVNGKESQSALFGSVGAALAVGAIVVVCIVFIVVAVRRREKNNNGIPKGISNTKCDLFIHEFSALNCKHYQ